LPFFDVGGVDFVALLIIHVVVGVGVYKCHDHIVVFRELHFETAREVRREAVLLRQFIGFRQFVNFVEQLQTVGK